MSSVLCWTSMTRVLRMKEDRLTEGEGKAVGKRGGRELY